MLAVHWSVWSHDSPLWQRLPLDAILILAVVLALPVLSSLALLLWVVFKSIRRWGSLALRSPMWIEGVWLARASMAILIVYAAAFAYAYLVEAHWVEKTATEVVVREPVLGRDRFRI